MKKLLILLALVAVLLSACGAQAPLTQDAPLATATVMDTATAIPPTSTATPVPPSATPAPVPTATPGTLFPTVTFTEKVVCRLGPDVNYFPVVTFSAGKTSQAQGRSEDSGWLIVMSQVPIKSPTCWVPVASVENFGNVGDLTVSIAPPLPVGPSSATTAKFTCGNRAVPGMSPVVYWSPVVDGVGYYVFRNGKNHATIFGGYFVERDTPNSKNPYVYTYGIQAFNSVGLSKVTASVSVTLCK
jgi:hypothetical protein